MARSTYWRGSGGLGFWWVGDVGDGEVEKEIGDFEPRREKNIKV
jgi:hypothetical protein